MPRAASGKQRARRAGSLEGGWACRGTGAGATRVAPLACKDLTRHQSRRAGGRGVGSGWEGSEAGKGSWLLRGSIPLGAWGGPAEGGGRGMGLSRAGAVLREPCESWGVGKRLGGWGRGVGPRPNKFTSASGWQGLGTQQCRGIGGAAGAFGEHGGVPAAFFPRDAPKRTSKLHAPAARPPRRPGQRVFIAGRRPTHGRGRAWGGAGPRGRAGGAARARAVNKGYGAVSQRGGSGSRAGAAVRG